MNMFKKFSMLLLIAGLIFSFQSQALSAEKMAFVDLSRLFDEYYKTKDYDKTLETKHNEFEKDRNEKIEKIRESQGKLGLLTDEKKSEMEEEIEQLKADLIEYDRQNKTDLTKERNEKIREILLEIEKEVSDYAEKNGIDVILNDRVLIFGNPTLDLTEQILSILNKGQQ
ncbi:MAG: OmpH family outer membrane protein [Candidatus Omnitrophica bacterium]|nr:OmpH family outer membrane protein [Candidatus Omnitrophota bacterium]